MEFIENLYNNGIYPSEENTRPACVKYDDLQGKLLNLNRQLQESLNDEQKDLLNQLLEIKLSIQSFETATSFANGFRLGGRFVCEIYK
jgi:hypothetical protein